ncbi:unnamed protein product, partial [Brassica oleracea var. botrytis]
KREIGLSHLEQQRRCLNRNPSVNPPYIYFLFNTIEIFWVIDLFCCENVAVTKIDFLKVEVKQQLL